MKNKAINYIKMCIKSEIWVLFFIISQMVGALTIMIHEIYTNDAYADKFLEIMEPVYDNMTWLQQYHYLLNNGYALIANISSSITIVAFIAFLGIMIIYFISKKISFYVKCKIRPDTSSKCTNVAFDKKETKFVNIKTIHFVDAIKYMALGLILNSIVSIIIPLIYKILPASMNEMYENSITTALSQSGLIMFFATGICAPVVEELTFRYGMLGMSGIEDVNSKEFKILNLFQAIIFGALHGNLIQGTYALILGYFFGYVDIKNKSVIPSILMHTFVNSSSAIIYLLIQNSYTAEKEMIGMLIIGAIGIAIISILAIKNKIFKTRKLETKLVYVKTV